MAKPRRQFVDGPYGQVHLRVAGQEGTSHRPLACLHMSPLSGRSFDSFMRIVGQDRMVVAPDYPGYGESDPPPSSPNVSIEDYAAAMWTVVDRLNLTKVDLLGHHTGSKVAAEMVMQREAAVGKVIMVAAGLVDNAGESDNRSQDQDVGLVPLDEAGTRFATMWDATKQLRGPGMTLEDMAEFLAESLRSGENCNWAWRAADAYNGKFPKVLKELSKPVLVINPGDELFEATKRAQSLLRNSLAIDRPEWGHGLFNSNSSDLARLVTEFLKT